MADTERAGWDGARYDRLADPQANWGRVVLERLELAGSETIVDAGCGSGRVTEELLAKVPNGHVIAIDASESMLDNARMRLAGEGDRVAFVHTDLLELSTAMLGTQVDAVFSTATFHWILDHDRLFRRIAQVLVQGGQLVAQCGGKGNITSVIEAVRSLGVDRVGTWYYASPERTTEALAAAGFTDIEVWLNQEPTPFDTPAHLADFLETICLREHVATLPPAERSHFAEQVVAAMPEISIDYVRLNITARRS